MQIERVKVFIKAFARVHEKDIHASNLKPEVYGKIPDGTCCILPAVKLL